jgi:hypothetical protein
MDLVSLEMDKEISKWCKSCCEYARINVTGRHKIEVSNRAAPAYSSARVFTTCWTLLSHTGTEVVGCAASNEYAIYAYGTHPSWYQFVSDKLLPRLVHPSSMSNLFLFSNLLLLSSPSMTLLSAVADLMEGGSDSVQNTGGE